tara:strand:- start:2 stop:187 length:186 start_codon:yes stop_codon:yes gene_type:complete
MSELLLALGIIFFFEGLILAIFPSRIKSMLELVKKTSVNNLRIFGTVFLIIGFVIIWFIKN